MTDKKYCVATCHQGTEMGIFLSGPDDERLTLEEAKNLAEPAGLLTSDVNGKGKFLFDCTAEQYWKMEREALDDPWPEVDTTTRYSGEHPDDRFKPSPFYHECKMCKGEHIAGWGIWDNAEDDWIVPDGFESKEQAAAVAEPFNHWAADKGL